MKKALLFILWPMTLAAQNSAIDFDTYMQGHAGLYGFNGNVLVMKQGVVVYKKSFGYANYSTQQKLDSNSVFDCGSIAKEFTAMGILLLKDKGKISYTDSLRKFFPELPYYNITIQQMLTHTSGLPDGFSLVTKFFDHSKVASNKDLIRLLAQYKPPVFFKPGENLMYSGTAFNLLASIIEKVSGLGYNRYMSERIFIPLQMNHTLVSNKIRTHNNTPHYADGYLYSDSLKNYVPASNPQTGWTSYLAGITGEGMIITTTADLLKWDRALKNSTLLTPASQREMLSVQAVRTVIPSINFGYGMRTGTNAFGAYYFHEGWYPGYASMHLHYTADDVTAIVLSNNESHSSFIADALCAIALGKEIVIPKVHTQIKTGKPLPAFSGKYMMVVAGPPFMGLFPTEFVVKDGKLFLHPGRGAEIELKQESDKKFFFADGTDQQLEFELNSDGSPGKLWQITWGVKKEVSKID